MNNLYEENYDNWIQKQKECLKSKDFDNLDIENLIEELVSMSRHDRKELVSFIKVLIEHLLKWNYYSVVLKDLWVDEKVLDGWRNSIDGPREDIEQCLIESPSLKSHLGECLEKGFKLGKRKAIKGINTHIKNESKKLNNKSFPDICPWSFEQIIKEDFFPEDPIGGSDE